jgi:hypothetical protein
MKLETQNSYVANPQFVGGVAVTPTGSSAFNEFNANNPQFGFVAGGLYVGRQGSLVAKTYDGSVLTFVSCSGFVPGIFTAVSSSSTDNMQIIALR